MARSEREGAASSPGSERDSSILERALEIARDWAGPDVLALFLSGSHASREAVWGEAESGPVLLSDIDLYALMPDPAAVSAATSRMRKARRTLHRRTREIGLVAPIEAAFFTPAQLRGMIARPATIDLARHARVIAGEERWRDRIPRFGARDVSEEEIRLLHDNRGMELLYALALSERTDRVSRLQRCHATLKAALDLAAVMCLVAGEYPDGAAARVTLARGLRGQQLDEAVPWEEGIAWKLGELDLPDERTEMDHWAATVRGWAEIWRRLHGVAADAAPWDRLLESAGRAPLKRRLREAFSFRAAGRRGPSLASRVGRWSAGTPLHRVHASGAALLLRIADQASDAAAYARVARTLGVIPQGGDVESAARLVRRWDDWILGGQRTADWP